MERVSTAGLTQTMLALTLATQSRMAEKQVQQASSLLSTTYAGLGSKSGTIISLESELSRLMTWSDNTQLALSRVEAMSATLGDMTDLMTTLRSTLGSALSETSDVNTLNQEGLATLEDLADFLNLQMDGRYLFAGALTKDPPVPNEASAYPVPTVPSSADFSYYVGDDAVSSVRISANQTVAYGVTADEPAFEKAIRAAGLLANMATNPVDTAAVEEAYALATEALDGMLAIQGSLSVTAGRLEGAIARQETSAATVEQLAKDIKSADMAEITVKLAEYEAILQASYSALATLSSLSLTRYL